MVNPVVVAFFVDVVASLSSQIGLVMQKLAHHHQEKNKVYEVTNTPCSERKQGAVEVSEHDD